MRLTLSHLLIYAFAHRLKTQRFQGEVLGKRLDMRQWSPTFLSSLKIYASVHEETQSFRQKTESFKVPISPKKLAMPEVGIRGTPIWQTRVHGIHFIASQTVRF